MEWWQTMTLSESDLRESAGAYVAGELAPDEVSAFESLLAVDEQLASEVAFWRQARQALARHGRPAAARPPGPALAERIAVRLEREAVPSPQSARPSLRIDPWRWAGWAAAALVLFVFGWRYEWVEPAYFDERGAPVAGAVQALPVTHPDAGARPDTVHRPTAWLGVGVKPVTLPTELIPGRTRALQVRRIATTSPAYAAGIRSGDLLLEAAGCPMESRLCIANAIGTRTPGATVSVRYYASQAGEVREVSVELGAMWE